jgi:hypothetical protein
VCEFVCVHGLMWAYGLIGGLVCICGLCVF